MVNEALAEKIINLEMFNFMTGFYFMNDIYDTPHVKQLLVDRFTLLQPEHLSGSDPGKIYSVNDPRAAEICIALNVNKHNVLFCYEQKKENYFAFTFENTIESKKNIVLDTEASPVTAEGIKVSQALSKLLKNLKKIKPDYVINRIDSGSKLQHPVKKSKKSECQFYIKTLALLCNEYGFSALQLLRLAELCCCFGISSHRLNQLLKFISEAENERNTLLNAVYENGVFSDKAVMVTELLYMIWLGKYDAETEFRAILRVGELTGSEPDSVLTIYDKLKEST